MRKIFDISDRHERSRVSVEAADVREIYDTALASLASFVRPDVSTIRGNLLPTRVHVRGKDFSETMENFLSRALFENDMQSAVFFASHIIHCSQQEIECELLGKRIDHWEEYPSTVRLLGPIMHDGVLWRLEYEPRFEI